MKLRSGFITQKIDGTLFLVSTGEESFSGFVRSNSTAAFIVDCLKEETTEDKIIEAMCSMYDAPRQEITADVKKILDPLRGIHALSE